MTSPQQTPAPTPCDEGAALYIALYSHRGQIDKQGQPVIDHVLRVRNASPPGDAKIVATLHDVVEDTSTTLAALAEFPSHIVEAVDAITRRSTETYAHYIQRVARNPLARVVKIADLHDNLSRGAAFPSLCERYRKALAVLDSPTPPTTVEGATPYTHDEMEEEIDRLRRMLKTATVRLGILRDRMEGCDEGGEIKTHTLSLDEIPAWIAEQDAVLGARGAGAKS